MASESSGRTFQEYLEHPLQNLVFGPLPEGHERKFYSKGETTSEKEIYCQDKNSSRLPLSFCAYLPINFSPLPKTPSVAKRLSVYATQVNR